MDKLRLDEMSDEGLLERVGVLVRRSNEITAELLAYIAEVETRGLHLREATGSMFAYCVERLHMSEATAGKRITAARTARRFPLALEMIARGEIHLSGLNLLGPLLTEANHAELLGRARHQSKRAIEKLVAEIAPRPDVPSRVTALPRPAVVSGCRGPALEGARDAREVHAPGPVACAPVSPPAVMAPLSPRRYQIRVTVDEDTHSVLTQLQDLLSHQVPDRDPAVIISRALELLLERTLASKACASERPRPPKAPGKRTRHIPAAVRRQVWKRDAGQCAFVDQKGRRCSSSRFLEYHHVRNWARGAEHEPKEIELRCRAHNQYQAVLDYGAGFMAERRRGGSSRAEEPSPAYGISVPGSGMPVAGPRGARRGARGRGCPASGRAARCRTSAAWRSSELQLTNVCPTSSVSSVMSSPSATVITRSGWRHLTEDD